MQTLGELVKEFTFTQSLVAARRKEKGPLFESWSATAETTVELARALQRNILEKPTSEQIEAFRSLLSFSLPTSTNIRKSKSQIAGVDVTSFSKRGASTKNLFTRKQKQATGKCVVHFHGGGYCFGSVDNAAPFFSQLLLKRRAEGVSWKGSIFSVNYALAPEHAWPAALDDATGVVDALTKIYGAQNIMLCGDSAGGGLALATAISRRESGQEKVAGVIGISPWVSLSENSRGYDRARETDLLLEKTVRACKDWLCPASPTLPPSLDVIRASLHELPPLLLLVGEAELFYDDVLRFAGLAEKAGGDVVCHVGKDMPHVWPFFPMLGAESQRGLEAMVNFTHRVLPSV
ncbi:MAG: alpha/beta hydrolase [Deltaproteobacteria bacterium]|nr:alpha/beta hydrolase [Deltaproteobacteria bacterium]